MFNVTQTPLPPAATPQLPSQPQLYKIYSDIPGFPTPKNAPLQVIAQQNEHTREKVREQGEKIATHSSFVGRDFYNPILRGRVGRPKHHSGKSAVREALERQHYVGSNINDRIACEAEYWTRLILAQL